tara:strand:+ start:5949 stop:7079 length:1131 start_codon:yes stop_codon:yes gene_type:complete
LKREKILVVGAGFAGATIARVLAENSIRVHVIDKRSHIGGNAYDFLNSNNERIHKYGPHLLHGNKESKAISFLNRFTAWIKYEHKVRALLEDGRTTPLPVNRTTLEDIFDLKLENDFITKKFIEEIRYRDLFPKNCDELFLSNFGEEITNIFFRPYTRKMWGIDPKELGIGIGTRLPIRTNNDSRYFTDTFQALPKNGYKFLFENIFSHKNITLGLNTEFEKSMEKDYAHIFLCSPIDMYFGYCYGVLPYRSIIFEERQILGKENLDAPVINFTDNSKFTRKTQWNLFPNCPKCNTNKSTLTYEIPVNIEENPGEYYYPVQTNEAKKLYNKYLELSKKFPKITFCGRTGLFRYIDMIPSVTMHLSIAHNFIKKFNK